MEFVYVIRREDVFDDVELPEIPQGFNTFEDSGFDGDNDFVDIVGERGYFIEREHAEEDMRYKQIIPYTMLVSDGHVFVMRRLKKGGEKRLHGLRSFGVGGHINPCDFKDDRNNVIYNAMGREIEEEIEGVPANYSAEVIGMINDDSVPVSAVHLGLASILKVDSKVRYMFSVKETDQLEGEWMPIKDIRKQMKKKSFTLENWSELLLPYLESGGF